MNFRLFIYLCAVCGGWAALLGWLVGRIVAGPASIASAGIKAMCLGMLVALALAVVDNLWNFSRGQLLSVVPRVLAALLVGTIGGLIGGVIAEALYDWRQFLVFYILGWTITGLLVGASLGAFDVVSLFVRQENIRGVLRKFINGIMGGTVGGLLGGILSFLLRVAWNRMFQNVDSELLWSPSAMGFVALGICIGLMIGLAQVMFRETWIKIEAGLRAGELILAKPEITIGRAEGCDIGLFGDASIERLHARIRLETGGYMLADAGTPSGTFLNEDKIGEPTLLRLGRHHPGRQDHLAFWRETEAAVVQLGAFLRLASSFWPVFVPTALFLHSSTPRPVTRWALGLRLPDPRGIAIPFARGEKP